MLCVPVDVSTDLRYGSEGWPTRLVAGCLVTVVAVVPAVFWIEAEEIFAIPKLVALVTIASVCVIVVGVASLVVPRPQPRLCLVDAFVAAYGLAVAVSFATSVDPGLSLWGERFQRQGLVPTLTYVALYGLARLAISDHRRFGSIVRSAAAGATFVAVYAVMQRAGLDPIWDELPQGRVFSTIGQPNSLGAYLAMTVPLAVAAARLERRGATRGLWWTAVTILLVALLFTLSRGAYLALAVAIGVGAIPAARSRLRRRPRGLAVAAATGTVAVVAIIAVVPTFAEIGDQGAARMFAAPDLRTGSVRDHLDLWKVAAEIVTDHPAVGTGPDTFPEAFDDYRDDALDADRARRFAPYRVESAHNIFLTAAAGSGLAAALALAAALLRGIHLGLRRPHGSNDEPNRILARATGTALLAYVIANSFITAEIAGSATAWILLGSVAANSMRAEPDHGRADE